MTNVIFKSTRGALDIDILKLQHLESSTQLYQHLKTSMINHVKLNPKRSLIILKSVQSLTSDHLPALDVLLDALGGRRAKLDNVDFRNSIILLLFKINNKNDVVGDSWRSYLEEKWAYPGPEFTPSAVIGRIGGAMAIESFEKCTSTTSTAPIQRNLIPFIIPIVLSVSSLVLYLLRRYTATAAASTKSVVIKKPRRRSKSVKRRKRKSLANTSSGLRRSSRLEALSATR